MAATLVGLVGSATAKDVTVSPDNMQGWSIATANGAKAKLTTGGAAAYGREKPFVSDDGKDFGKPVKKGEFAGGKNKKTVTFDQPVKCSFFKLRALSEINDNAWSSAAEIGVVPAE